MKALLLAEGFGTRISEETALQTKTYSRNRQQTYFMAHYENVFQPRN
jgi:hypothetical protein